jgi:hypothetical protein
MMRRAVLFCLLFAMSEAMYLGLMKRPGMLYNRQPIISEANSYYYPSQDMFAGRYAYVRPYKRSLPPVEMGPMEDEYAYNQSPLLVVI